MPPILTPGDIDDLSSSSISAAVGGKSLNNPDDFIDVYGPPSALDYEFEGSTSSLPPGWFWVNQGTATYEESLGAAHLIGTQQIGDAARMIMQSLASAPSTWTATYHLTGIVGSTTSQTYGPALRDSVSGRLCVFTTNHANTTNVTKWTDLSTVTTNFLTGFNNYRPMTSPAYWRIRKNSPTSWDFEFSMDGHSWRTNGTASNIDISTFLTPDQIGMTMNCNGGDTNVLPKAAFHWFRFR